MLWQRHTPSTTPRQTEVTQRNRHVLTCLLNVNNRWGKRNVGVVFPLHSVKNIRRSLTFHFGSLYVRDPAESYWLLLHGFRIPGKRHAPLPQGVLMVSSRRQRTLWKEASCTRYWSGSCRNLHLDLCNFSSFLSLSIPGWLWLYSF